MGLLSQETVQKSPLNSDGKELRFGGQPGEKWVPIAKPWRFQIGPSPKCIAFHGLDGMDLEVWRVSGPCDEFVKRVTDVPSPLQEGCPYLFVKPGMYEVRLTDGTDEMPETFYPECIQMSIEQARLMVDSALFNFVGSEL